MKRERNNALPAIYQRLACALVMLGSFHVIAQEEPVLQQEASFSAIIKPMGSNYILGQGMPLTLVLFNRSDVPIRLAESYWWEWDFPVAKLSVTNSEGRSVARVEASYERFDRFNGSVKWTVVPAKAEIKWQMNMDRKFVLTNAGSYFVSAHVGVPPQDDGSPSFQITTPTVRFEIKPASTNTP